MINKFLECHEPLRIIKLQLVFFKPQAEILPFLMMGKTTIPQVLFKCSVCSVDD